MLCSLVLDLCLLCFNFKVVDIGVYLIVCYFGVLDNIVNIFCDENIWYYEIDLDKFGVMLDVCLYFLLCGNVMLGFC